MKIKKEKFKLKVIIERGRKWKIILKIEKIES